MNQKTKIITSSILFVVLSALSINAFAVWTGPGSNPVSDNVSTPLLTNEALQRKPGGVIFEFGRFMGLLLVGGKAEFADTIKIYGGNPGLNKVLVSDNVGLASWVDPSTLPGWGGSGPTPQGVVPISLGGTGLTTIAANSIWVANDKDIVSTLTPGPGNSIRLNSAGTAWEQFTPLISNGNGGTINNISKFTGAHVLGDSQITDDGTTITTGGNFKVGENLIYSTVVKGLTANVTNFELQGGVNFYIDPIPTSSNWTIQGFSGDHTHGRVVHITNRSTGTYIIKNNSTITATGNRVQTSGNADLTLASHKSIMLVYDITFNGGGWLQISSTD